MLWEGGRAAMLAALDTATADSLDCARLAATCCLNLLNWRRSPQMRLSLERSPASPRTDGGGCGIRINESAESP